jgi:protein MpaA
MLESEPTPPAPLGPASIKQLLLPLFLQVATSSTLRADSLGFWRVGEERFWLPRFVFQRTTKVKQRIKIAIFAGIHGDEPAGTLGLMDFVRALDEDPLTGRDYQLWLYPVCNPTGYLDGTRHARSGVDLNREFWHHSAEPEVQLLEQEIMRQKFDGIISLHCDDTSDGVYGFVSGSVLAEHLLKPALEVAEQALPRNKREQIDGFHAIEGIIYSGYGAAGYLARPF